jgi:hypothetical protein
MIQDGRVAKVQTRRFDGLRRTLRMIELRAGVLEKRHNTVNRPQGASRPRGDRSSNQYPEAEIGVYLLSGSTLAARLLRVIVTVLYRPNGENLIERSVDRLKQFRRVATRYEKTARTYIFMLCIAAAKLRIKTVNTASSGAGVVVGSRGGLVGNTLITASANLLKN